MKKINLLIYLIIFFSLFSCSFESKPKIEGEINEVVKILVSEVLLMDNNFSNQTHLRNDLGADELDIVEITIALENQYDIVIPDDDVAQFVTIGDIVTYIKNSTPNMLHCVCKIGCQKRLLKKNFNFCSRLLVSSTLSKRRISEKP